MYTESADFLKFGAKTETESRSASSSCLLRLRCVTIPDVNRPWSMLINCIRLYIADAVDFIHALVPAVFFHSHTSHTYSTAVAVSDKDENK